jgi:hypothetical protein
VVLEEKGDQVDLDLLQYLHLEQKEYQECGL